MASFNKVILMGNLTRDPELKYLPSGTAVVKFSLATNRKWKDRNTGESREEVCFIDCEAFSRRAEVIDEYFSKGKPIMIEGRLRLQTWETDDGQRRSKHDILIDNFIFVSSPRDEEGSDGGGYSRSGRSQSGDRSSESAPPPTDDDIPF